MLFSGHYLSLWFLDSDEANCYFTLRGARVTGSREKVRRVNQIIVQQDMVIDDDDFTNQLERDKAVMSQCQTLAGADRQFYNIVTAVFYIIIE
jgi:hypothetical protein